MTNRTKRNRIDPSALSTRNHLRTRPTRRTTNATSPHDVGCPITSQTAPIVSVGAPQFIRPRTTTTLQQLKKLNISFPDKITDIGLVSVAVLHELEHLDLTRCNEITDAGLASVVSLEKLKHLNLSSCYNLTKGGLVGFASLAQLHTLILRISERADTDTCLVRVAALQQLQVLKLLRCKKNTRLLSVASLIHLTRLDLFSLISQMLILIVLRHCSDCKSYISLTATRSRMPAL